jgi:hypothetical protein
MFRVAFRKTRRIEVRHSVIHEAHAINYTVSFPANQPSVVFESAGPDNAPRFRLTYEMGSDSLRTIEFSIAAQSGEFQKYTAGRARCKGNSDG